MGFLEKIIGKIERRTNSDEYRFEIKQKAQIELIQMAGGDDFAGTWIDANGRRFEELMNDQEFDFINRLANKETRTETLKEIQSKFYH